MQQRAGLLFLSKDTGRILLILEDQLWTVPTFQRQSTLLNDAEEVLNRYSQGKIIPIELYHSKDNGFQYGTYVCLVADEFLIKTIPTVAWCDLKFLPKNLHLGLKQTLNNSTVKTKIETILELENYASTI